MVSYVTLAGKSSWALINSYYSSLRRGLKVERILIVVEDRDVEKVELLKRAVEEVSAAYGMSPEIKVLSLKFPPDINLLKKMFRRMGDIVLDITAGRKSLVMVSIVALSFLGGKVIYLSLLEEDEGEKPHMMIPLHLQKTIEVEVSGVHN